MAPSSVQLPMGPGAEEAGCCDTGDLPLSAVARDTQKLQGHAHPHPQGVALEVEEQRMTDDWLGWWHGWIWRRGQWRRVCVAGTMAEASTALSRIADRQRVADAHSCLTRGGAPDWTPPTRSRTPTDGDAHEAQQQPQQP
jgi:hypothetical protein